MYLNELIDDYNPVRSFGYLEKILLVERKVNYKVLENIPFYGPKLWNSFSENIRSITDATKFKSILNSSFDTIKMLLQFIFCRA